MWDDLSDGLYSLNVTTVTLDPKNPKRVYAAANGILYRSEDTGFTWTPLVRFSGSTRTSIQNIDQRQQIQKIKEKILEEKLEDLAAEIGETRAEEARPQLEREAEEEAEDRIRQLARSGTGSTSLTNRFRRFIYRIKLSPTNPKLILVATDGGAFMSTNGGKDFRSAFRGRGGGPEGHILTANVDPLNAKRMLLGSRRGLWLTKDGGKNWKRIFGKLRTLTIREIRRDPANPRRIYIATPRAIFVSDDNGNNFRERYTLTSSGPQRITTITCLSTNPTTIILGTGNGLYRSQSPDARRFKPLRAMGIGVRNISYITSIPTAPTRLYLLNERGVFLSMNQGRHFRQLRDGMPTQSIRYITISQSDPNQIWAATDYGLMQWSRLLGGKVTRAQWKRFRKKLANEPSPWRLSHASLKYMHLDLSLKKTHNRYRFRAFLPQLRIQGYLFLDRDQNNLLLPKTLADSVLESRQFVLQGLAIWKLDELIYAKSEANVVALLRTTRKTRDKMINRVVRLYYSRRRAQLRLFARPPKELRRYMRRFLKLQELTAHLDGLSGGYLSKKLKLSR